MIDRQIRRAALAAVMALGLVPATGFAFPQSTETSGEIPTDLNGTWLVVNRLEFTRPSPTPIPGESPAPAASPAASGPSLRPFTVAYIFSITHLRTEEAQAIRDADKAKRQASIAKANKILAEELAKGGQKPQPLASGETPVEPKAMGFGIPRPPDSVVDLHDEVGVTLHDVVMPKTIQDAIDAANKAEKPWLPSEKELTVLKSSWKTLQPPARTEYSRIDWKVLQDKYLEGGMQQDEKTKNAKFVISGDSTLITSPGQANRNILVYGAEKIGDGVIEGGHVRAIMTAAPFPIPIDMKGVFKMYRLTAPAKAAKKAK